MKFWPERNGRREKNAPGKADLHIHTDFSDGLSSVPRTLDWIARHTDLDVIAITDHDTLEGAWLARSLARKYDYPFEVVIGTEVSTADGHLLALYIDRPVPAGRSIEETIDLIHAQDGLCVLPHPYSRTGLMLASPRYQQFPERAYDLPLDGIESFNGAMLISRCNTLSGQLAQQLQQPTLAGSDAHVCFAIGSATTHFPGRSAADLRQAIVAGQVEAAGCYWSPYAYFMTGFQWTWHRSRIVSLPGLGFLRAGQRIEIS